MNPLHRLKTLQLLQVGQEHFPALVQAIDGASAWVQMETCIFDTHPGGADVANGCR